MEYEGINSISNKPNVTAKKRINRDGKISHKCKECDLSWATIAVVQKHILNEHKLGNFNCNLSNYKTSNSRFLYVHMKGKHDIPSSVKLTL